MNGVTLDLFVAMTKALVKVHGDRLLTPEQMEKIRAGLEEIEVVYLKAEPAKKGKR